MLQLQIACLAVVSLTAAREWRGGRGARFAGLALAAWLAEGAAIAAFDLHLYTPGWWIPLGQVPALAPLIWATVITTGGALAGERPWGGALAVTADLMVLGPVGIQSGLWSWRRSGLFDFPLEASLGWGAFAAGWWWALRWSQRRGWPLWERLAVAAPVATLAGLGAGGALGAAGLDVIVPHPLAVAVAFAISLAITAGLIARGQGGRRAVVARLPGMALVGVLLAAYTLDVPPFLAFTVAALPPLGALWMRPQ